jgi:hypothetical protein
MNGSIINLDCVYDHSGAMEKLISYTAEVVFGCWKIIDCLKLTLSN